jgi:hypothetical protein
MKNNVMKRIMYLASILFLASAVLVSCKDDDVKPIDENPILVEDGLYIKGAGTALTEYDLKGLMKSTRNEVGQVDRPALKELFVAVKAGSEGFNIIDIAGSTATIYGPGADFAVVDEAARIGEEPKLDFWRGTLSETQTAFTVPQDGLYHVVVDTEFNKVAIIPVAHWGLIGAATPGGWSNDTPLNPGAFDLNTMTFEATNVPMTKSNYKFRYSGGWKVIIDGDAVTGVRVNTNMGGAVNNLVPGGDDIANDAGGLYTARMVWTLGQPYAATITKTGELEMFDYTDTELGLVGNALVEGDPDWTVTVQLQKPVLEGETVYIWTFEGVEIKADGGFKIREGNDWSGLSFGYPQVTMAGLSADNFANADGNFIAKEDGTFDIIFKIDALTDVMTFTVNPAGAAPELYMLGNGTPAGWDNNQALPMTGTDGSYSITSVLPGGGEIKFITVLGQWQPQYGTDATGTSTSGPLFVNDGTGSDPAGIPAPAEAGTYLIEVDTNAMTYTITAATK